MTQIIVQPAAGAEARIHYANTIETPVPLARVRPFFSDSEFQRLSSFYTGDSVWVWGARPGVHNKWARIQTGDIVLFYRQKRFIQSATVTLVCQNPELAIDLWGRDPDDETWEYIYFVNDLDEADIGVEEFCLVVGYKPNFTPQGLMVLDQQKSDLLIEEYGLEGEGRKLQDFVDAIDAEPDNPRLGNVRGEQSELRRRLLRGRIVAPCSICGESLPEDMLVAAHIKKRSQCSRQEKLDPQVVVLMCKLGCDALYEYGYLSVVNGVVTTRHRATDSVKITQLLGRIHGREFVEWTANRSKYFDWHTANTLRSN